MNFLTISQHQFFNALKRCDSLHRRFSQQVSLLLLSPILHLGAALKSLSSGLSRPKVAKMFPQEFHWAMLGLNSASIVSNVWSLKCVLDTFNIDVTLFRILSLDGIFSLAFSFLSAITHLLSGLGLMQGRIKCSMVLITTMTPYINGILCSLMISLIR